MAIAIILELLMLATFIHEHSWQGIVLWALYLYFSATWAAIERLLDKLNPPPPPFTA